MALKFDSIKSLFIVDTPDNKETKPEEKQTKEEKVSPIETAKKPENTKISWKSSAGTGQQTDNTNTETVKSAGTSETGVFNQQIFNSLTKAISDANLPGEDYLEFVQALKAMKDIPLELNIKIQTVLATLSTKGLTISKVIESADYYMNVLENEKRKFYEALELNKKSNVSQNRVGIDDLEKENKQKEEMIVGLKKEIIANQEKIDKIKSEIIVSESKIKKTEDDFILTFQTVANQIKDNVENIKKLTV